MRKFTRKLTHFGDTKMAKSSIKFARTQANSVEETTREFEAHYLLEKKYRLKNEYWNCGKTDSQVFKEELAKTKRKGGPKPKLENSLWEAILNLNHEHTMADVQRAVKLVEKKFNIICTRVAIHRDEGHLDKEGKVVYNLHAHLNFVTYKNGRQNWRQKFIRPMMSNLQTEIAKELKMERGRFKDETGVVAMGHREYRAHAKTVEKIQELVTEKEKELVTEKEKSAYNFREYQQRITGLETENTDLKKELHRLNTQVKNGQASVQALEERIEKAKESVVFYKDLTDKKTELIEFWKQKAENPQDTARVQELQTALESTNSTLDIVQAKLTKKDANLYEFCNSIGRVHIEFKMLDGEKPFAFLTRLIQTLFARVQDLSKQLESALSFPSVTTVRSTPPPALKQQEHTPKKEPVEKEKVSSATEDFKKAFEELQREYSTSTELKI